MASAGHAAVSTTARLLSGSLGYLRQTSQLRTGPGAPSRAEFGQVGCVSCPMPKVSLFSTHHLMLMLLKELGDQERKQPSTIPLYSL